ncbi:hypothetical protein VTN49DRAFT_2786 [Thermomyces lanuginosus]|uniref:uncharacterized protein n=1 Tax=Thermomyces lanuginosus TaxID=5541 RepID=UPI0037439747
MERRIWPSGPLGPGSSGQPYRLIDDRSEAMVRTTHTARASMLHCAMDLDERGDSAADGAAIRSDLIATVATELVSLEECRARPGTRGGYDYFDQVAFLRTPRTHPPADTQYETATLRGRTGPRSQRN